MRPEVSNNEKMIAPLYDLKTGEWVGLHIKQGVSNKFEVQLKTYNLKGEEESVPAEESITRLQNLHVWECGQEHNSGQCVVYRYDQPKLYRFLHRKLIFNSAQSYFMVQEYNDKIKITNSWNPLPNFKTTGLSEEAFKEISECFNQEVELQEKNLYQESNRLHKILKIKTQASLQGWKAERKVLHIQIPITRNKELSCADQPHVWRAFETPLSPLQQQHIWPTFALEFETLKKGCQSREEYIAALKEVISKQGVKQIESEEKLSEATLSNIEAFKAHFHAASINRFIGKKDPLSKAPPRFYCEKEDETAQKMTIADVILFYRTLLLEELKNEIKIQTGNTNEHLPVFPPIPIKERVKIGEYQMSHSLNTQNENALIESAHFLNQLLTDERALDDIWTEKLQIIKNKLTLIFESLPRGNDQARPLGNNTAPMEENFQDLIHYLSLIREDNSNEDLERQCSALIKKLKKQIAYNNKFWQGKELVFAIYCNEIEIVRDMVKEGVKGTEPLLMACCKGHINIVKLLIDSGASVNGTNNGHLPLLEACNGEYLEMASLLIASGASVSACDKEGNTPLSVACENRHLEMVSLLIAKGASVDTRDKDGNTLLLVACEAGHLEVAQLLIEKGADVDAKTYSKTPLLSACLKGHIDIAKLLITSGASINVFDEYGKTPLLLACARGYLEIASLLVARGASVDVCDGHDNTPLLLACMSGHLEMARILIAHGASVNARNEHGNTPLLEACGGGHLEIVRLLIAGGVLVNAYDNTPLSVACEKGYLEIARLLIESGFSANARDEDGNTPLLVACKGGHVEIARLLIEKGAGVNAKNIKDKPIMLACYKGHFDVVELLIDSGALMNATSNKNNDTPLLVAYERGHLKIVELLIKRGAPVNIANPIGETLLFLACTRRDLKTVQLLLQKDARMDIPTDEGVTVFSCISRWTPEIQKELHAAASRQTNTHQTDRVSSSALRGSGGVVVSPEKTGAENHSSQSQLEERNELESQRTNLYFSADQ